MEPNYLDMSVDSLEASMARDILEASISVIPAKEAAPAAQVSGKGDTSDQSSQDKTEVEEEVKSETREEAEEEPKEEPKVDVKAVEIDQEEVNAKETTQQEVKLEEINQEEVKVKETNEEEVELGNTNQEEIKPKETNEEEVKSKDTNLEEAKIEETNQEEVKAEKDKEEDEESCESDRVILDDDCSVEDEELSNDQTQQQPSFQTAAGGHSIAADPSIIDQSNTTNYMEFTKNYSDDLLMGGGGITSGGGRGQQGHDMMPNADLADFELPPYSGSSSGSENQQQQQQSSSPIKSSQAQASSSATTSSSFRSHTNTQASPPSLTAVIELLLASYSRGAHLLQWKRPIETGVIFGIGATFIMALTFFSIISVIAYSALGLIFASASIRLYKTLMKTLNKSTDTPVDHVWNKVLALNVSISSDKLYELVDASHENLNSSLAYFKQVLLIEDKIAAIKFGIFLYILTYIGSWFNGMTLITIGYLALFSVPILYQQNKAKIDELLNLITGQMSSTIGMVTSRVSALAFGASASDSKKKN